MAKSLPVQVSKATVKPPQSLLFQSLSAASHPKESFPSPAASLAASAPAPSPVLEPSHHCFLLRWPGTHCHPLGASHCQEPGPGTFPGDAGVHQSATKFAAALQYTPQQSYSRDEKEDLLMV